MAAQGRFPNCLNILQRGKKSIPEKAVQIRRIAGLVLAAGARLYCTWFGATSGISEGIPPTGVAAHSATPGLVMLALTVAAYLVPRYGGMMMFSAGCLLTITYLMFAGGSALPSTVRLYVLLTKAAPILISGGLLFKGKQDKL